MSSNRSLPPAALQFNFENISGNTLPNLADTANSGIINSDCVVEKHSPLGDCLNFTNNDGHVHFSPLTGTGSSDFSGGVTVSFWINVYGTNYNASVFSLIQEYTKTDLLLKYSSHDSSYGWVLESGNNKTELLQGSKYLNQWVYMAVSIDPAGNCIMYVYDGTSMSHSSYQAKGIDLSNLADATPRIGEVDSIEIDTGCDMKLAWLSVYNQVLNATQLMADMALKNPGSQHRALPNAALQYNFENISGNTLPNLTGSQYDGIITGATTGSDYEMGGYLEFNGTELVKLPDLPGTGNFDFTKGITFCAWVNLADNKDGYHYIVDFISGNKQNNLSLQSAAQNQYYLFGSDCWISGQKNQPVDQWIFVAGTLDPSDNACLYVYANGVMNKTTGSGSASPSFSSVYATLGQTGNTIGGTENSGSISGISGKIAWLSVYNEALTETQIKADMTIKGPQPDPLTLPPAALQFNFENISGNSLPNQAGRQYDRTIAGATSGTDPEMGAYLEFAASDSVQIQALPGTGNSDFSNGYTMCAWIYLSTENGTGDSDEVTIFSLGSGASGAAQLNWGGQAWLFVDVSNGGVTASVSPTAGKGPGYWVYAAFTQDHSGLPVINIYGNGTWTSLAGTKTPIISELGQGMNFLGKNASIDRRPSFIGKLAWLSVYNQVLSKPLLELDMEKGKLSANRDYRHSFPVDFAVTTANINGDQIPTLFIEQQGQGKAMNLSISNSSAGLLNIPTGTGNISDTNYQFQLRFKPGVLSVNFLNKSQNSPGYWTDDDWQIAVYKDSKTGDGLLNLLNTGSGIQLLSGVKVEVNLGPVNADPIGGARNTAVLLQYKGLTQGSNGISGHRKQTLSIISHLGQKDIPLNVGVLGTPRVVNNGSSNELIIRVENTDPTNAIPLTSVLEKTKAKFEVGFVIQPEHEVTEWALIDYKKLSAKLDWPVVGVVLSEADSGSTSITLENRLTRVLSNTALVIEPVDGAKFKVTGTGSIGQQTVTLERPGLPQNIQQGAVVTLVANQSEWSISDNGAISNDASGYFSWTVQYEGTGELNSGDSIDFLIKDIVSNLPSGQAFITLKYFNLGGYWDGEFAIPVEKSLVSMNNTTVGIGLTPDKLVSKAMFQVPFTNDNHSVGLLVGDKDGQSGGVDSAITVMNNKGDGSAAFTLADGQDKVRFQIGNNGNVVFGDAPSTNIAMSMPYPNHDEFASGFIIGDGNSLKPSSNYALGISCNNQTGGEALTILDNNGNTAFNVDYMGNTTINNLQSLPSLNISNDSASGTIFSVTGANGNQIIDVDSSGTFTFNAPNQSPEHPTTMHIAANGFVGIGCKSIKYPLDVHGESNPNYTGGTLVAGINLQGVYPVSINCDDAFLASNILVPSDKRIKEVKKRSDNREDLATINQLEIQEYQFIDKVAKGDAVHKGLIAQELAEVVPHAVSRNQKFIPDIYALSTEVSYDQEQKSLTLQLAKAHELSVGEEVRLIVAGRKVDVIVSEILSDHSFKVEDWENDQDEVFVYGRLVSDFHTIDHDVVSMLGISAIQQLSKEVEALKQENASLKQQLNKEMTELRKEIEKLKQ